MQFCIITPISGLRRYATLSRTHLVLAHIQLPQYRQFYRERRKAGDLLILDNGAYEHKLDTEAVLRGIEYYQPNVVVLPDHLLSPWEKTWSASQKFLDLFHERYQGVEWMYVPHTTRGNIMGFIEGLYNAITDDRIRWIGLPRAMCTHYSMDPLLRVNCAEWLRNRWHGRVHALGMVKGNLAELPFLSRAGVYSIDSSAPVWRAWNKLSLKESSGVDCVPEVNFEETMGNVDHQLVMRNLEACGVNTNTSGVGSYGRDEGQEVVGG